MVRSIHPKRTKVCCLHSFRQFQAFLGILALLDSSFGPVFKYWTVLNGTWGVSSRKYFYQAILPRSNFLFLKNCSKIACRKYSYLFLSQKVLNMAGLPQQFSLINDVRKAVNARNNIMQRRQGQQRGIWMNPWLSSRDMPRSTVYEDLLLAITQGVAQSRLYIAQLFRHGLPF